MDAKKIKQIEKILGTKPDGVWGPDDKEAFRLVTGGGKPPAPSAPPPGMTPMPEAPPETPTYQ